MAAGQIAVFYQQDRVLGSGSDHQHRWLSTPVPGELPAAAKILLTSIGIGVRTIVRRS